MEHKDANLPIFVNNPGDYFFYDSSRQRAKSQGPHDRESRLNLKLLDGLGYLELVRFKFWEERFTWGPGLAVSHSHAQIAKDRDSATHTDIAR